MKDLVRKKEINIKKVDDLIVGNHWIINLFHFYFYFYFLFPPKIFYPSTAFEFLTLQYHYISFDICLWVLYHKNSGFFLLFPTSQFRFLILWENIEQPLSILFFYISVMVTRPICWIWEHGRRRVGLSDVGRCEVSLLVCGDMKYVRCDLLGCEKS